MTVSAEHPDDLVTTEGVDEGSAASAAEGADRRPPADQIGAQPSPGPAGESDAAPPQDLESDASRAARDQSGTGQQLAVGEG
jgi:hypothetical protein